MAVPPPPPLPDSADTDGPGRGDGSRLLKHVSVSMDDTLPVGSADDDGRGRGIGSRLLKQVSVSMDDTLPVGSADDDGPGRGVGSRLLKQASVSRDDTLPVGATYGRLANGATYGCLANPNQTDQDKVDNIKGQISELQISLSKLMHELEESEGKLVMHSKSDILLPEIRLEKQFKADGSLELDLVLAIAQCHDIFLCPYEVSHMTLRDHLSAPDAKIFRVRVVPGKRIVKDLSDDISTRHKTYIIPQRRKRCSLEPDPDLRKMSPLGKFVIAGIIECVFRLHRYGLSLNGKFSLDSFHITASKKVKLDAQLKSLVCCRNPDNMKIDYASIPSVIMQILSMYGDGFPIPFDLQYLLDLLSCEDPVSNEVIIRYNVSLMDEIGKRDHFIILFDRLQQIKKEDEQKGMKNYRLDKVFKYIVADDNDGWRDKLHSNLFVEMVRQRNLVDSKKTLEGAMGLLTTVRHNFTHLHEVSNEIQDKDQADIIDSVAPGLINQFQEGMHSIMEIDIPHLIKTMKM